MTRPVSSRSALNHWRRRRVCAALAVIVPFASVLTAAAARWNAQKVEDTTRLETGRPIEREISGGGKHVYQISLTEGQFASVVVAQRGIELVVRLVDADGTASIETESSGKDGRDVLEFTAERTAAYQIQLEPRYPKASAGRYQIRLDELRAASERDRLLYDARRQYAESLKAHRAGAYDKAQSLSERALATRTRVLGADHREVAASLNSLGVIWNSKDDYERAETLYQRALAIYEKTFGNDHPAGAEVLDNLAKNDNAKGTFADAERLAQQALNIREKRLGADHFLVAVSLGTLAEIYVEKGVFSKAEAMSDRALEIAQKAYGPDDLPLTDHMNRVARVQTLRGNYARAEQLLTPTLQTRERIAGKDSLPAADSLSHLAFLYLKKGNDDIKAEQLYRQSLAIKEKVLGPHHLQVALILNNMGNLSYRRRDYTTAEDRHKRSLEIKEKTVGPGHLLVAWSLNNLGLVYWRQKDYPRATEFFRRALELCEKWYGPESLEVAPSLGNLGIIAKETGDYESAERYYERSLAIFEKAYGKQHPELRAVIESLGILYRDRGDYTRAEPMFLRTLAITEGSLGLDHPNVARHLQNLVRLYAAKGDVANARSYWQRVSAIEEKNLPLNLAVGSERQRLAYFDPFAGTLEKIISFQIQQDAGSSYTRDLAATTLLQRKGRVLDAMAGSLGALRNRSSVEDRARLDQLNEVTSQLAALVLGGPQQLSAAEHQQRIKTLTEQRDKLENDVSQRSAGYYERTDAVTLGAVKTAIPADAALVEFVIYRPYDAKTAVESANTYGDPRYVAYILSARGEVRWKDLGRASDIDDAVEAMRQALRDPKRNDAKQFARALDEKVMRPIRALTGDATRLLVSPDGQLALIPFEALVDERGRYLVERYSVSYLTAGRDLLRMQVPRVSKSEPLVIADPLFGEPRVTTKIAADRAKPQAASAGDGRRAVTTGADLSSMYFAPLVGTRHEAASIKSVFPQVKVLTGAQASEPALKHMDAPRILHIATHGFFLEDAAAASTSGPATAPASGTRAIQASARIENPLLRSGLALSGANLNQGGTDDGILTALEAAQLNLWGTKLVILSACDTGVGVVKNGDGVYGLRRSMFLAGAETLVMSLWPVSDYVTREMMTAYYRGLKTGLGRGEALRQVQLSMLKRKGREHPFFWASFIQSGEWANLDGQR
jgi:CHAT domain-containing protein/Tfp pilus assembly protein PilF